MQDVLQYGTHTEDSASHVNGNNAPFWASVVLKWPLAQSYWTTFWTFIVLFSLPHNVRQWRYWPGWTLTLFWQLLALLWFPNSLCHEKKKKKVESHGGAAFSVQLKKMLVYGGNTKWTHWDWEAQSALDTHALSALNKVESQVIINLQFQPFPCCLLVDGEILKRCHTQKQHWWHVGASHCGPCIHGQQQPSRLLADKALHFHLDKIPNSQHSDKPHSPKSHHSGGLTAQLSSKFNQFEAPLLILIDSHLQISAVSTGEVSLDKWLASNLDLDLCQPGLTCDDSGTMTPC